MIDLIDVTDKVAQQHVLELLEKEESGKGLRLGVKGEVVPVLSYSITFDTEKERDNIVDCSGFKVLLDPKSAVYLKGVPSIMMTVLKVRVLYL